MSGGGTQIAPSVGSWNGPAGVGVRGTVIVLGGRGETPALYERFGTRISRDAYEVRVISDVSRDVEAARAAVSEILADSDLPSPKVLVGTDAGALLATELASATASGVDALVLVGVPVGAGAAVIDWDAELDARTACSAHRGVLERSARAGALASEIPAALAEVIASGVAVPTLAIHGGADVVAPLDDSLAFYRGIPSSETVVIEGGRHDVLNDVSHRTVAATIVLFLERVKLGRDAPLIARPV